MLHVFSGPAEVGTRSESDNSEKSDSKDQTDHLYSITSSDPDIIFDGTEFASPRMMSEDYANGLSITDEELMVNLDSFLKTFPSPPYTGNDPVWGSNELDDLCLSDRLLDADEEADRIKIEPSTPIQAAGISLAENEIEVETTSSNSGISAAEMPNQVQFQQSSSQQRYPTQRFAFSANGLLPLAPPAQPNSTGTGDRFVKINRQVQQPIRGLSNYSASYSPPPTPLSSKYTSDGAQQSGSCGTRGAVYARQYRQKNREHVEQLEAQNRNLVEENNQIRRAYEQARVQNEKLNREVTYLREVLQNQSAIASILKAVSCNAPGLKLQFPLSSDPATSGKQETEHRRTIETRASSKRKCDDQQTEQSTQTKKPRQGGDGLVAATSTGPGVCLHVNGETVSVEFCGRCNREARCVSDQGQRQQQ